MHTLSKSKIMAWRQCPKRLWLEIHRPDLRDDSGSETAFQIGYAVGEIARRIYVPNNEGNTIDIATLGHKDALATSAELLTLCEEPIFEAGFTADGALAYADVMLPERAESLAAWKMIEIKSSTHIKDYHRDDIAIQAHIAIRSGIQLTAVSLAHIDNTFVYPGKEDYRGLLKENDLTQETFSRADEVRKWIAEAHAVADLPEEPQFATGSHCSNPFPCGFSAYCNREKVWPEYPLGSLPRFSGTKKTLMETMGIDDLRRVPDEYLNSTQARVKAHTQSNTVFFDAAGAAADLAPYGFPARFLDFETTQFAIPIWPGTRPYAQIPFQFSLHILTEDGTLAHHSFLDLSGNDPTRSFAESLIDLCGSHGPVFVYASFEKRILRETAERFPEYAERLLAISQRIVDLLPIAKRRYYHPSQQGSWSLKAVLPAAIPELSYEKLEGIQDGGAAANAYIEAISPNTLPVRKIEIETQLTEYCKLDTYALQGLYSMFRGDKPYSDQPVIKNNNMNIPQIFAFAQILDEHARKLVYDEILKGRSRFGMFEQEASLKDEHYGKNAFLLRITPGDWIVHVNMPSYGMCVAVKVEGEYQFDSGIACPWGQDFNNIIPNDPTSIIEFDRSDINILPSVNLNPRKRGQRVLEVDDFLKSLENLKSQKYNSLSGQSRGVIHLRDRISTLLPEITKSIHEMNKGKEFEKLLHTIFKAIPNTRSISNGFGWRTDHGADLIVDFDKPVAGISLSSRLVVQVKSYEGQHFDLGAVDQIVQGIEEYDADGGLLITTAETTDSLRDYIRKKSDDIGVPIDLMAGDDVARFVLRYGPETLFG